MSSFMYWSPVVDNYLISDQPVASFLKGRFDTKTPMIMGTVTHETELFLRMVLRRPMTRRRVYEAWGC